MGTKKTILFGGAAACVLTVLAGQASAQTTPAAAPELEEVVVTGTRISRPNLEQPTPVSVLAPQQIQNAGTANLGDVVSRLPQVGTNSTVRANSNNFGNDAGLSAINLRSLGTSRTLVLVNGQRHVGANLTTGAVDINSIPTALVDRVEIITGGASAIYGSDAVSGVVNILLKKKFEGVDAQAQIGGYDNGFGAQYNAYGTVGHNFLDNRLNVTFTGFWNKQAAINASDVPSSHNYGTIVNPADVPPGQRDPTFFSSGSAISSNGVPNRLLVPNVGSDLLGRYGILLDPASFTPITGFDRAGNISPIPARTGYNSFAFGQLPANCVSCYFPEDFEPISSALHTTGANLISSYDFNDHLHANLDLKFVDTKVENLIQPSFSFGDFTLAPDNAYLTPAINALIAANGNGDPVYSSILGDARGNRIERRTYRVVGGLSGDFDGGFAGPVKWDLTLNYGVTDVHYKNLAIETTANFEAALDSVINPATGQPACRINVPSAQPGGYAPPAADPGCQPFNPFGRRNSAQQLGYVFHDYTTIDHLSQEVASFNVQSDTSRFLNLPGGPIAIAGGVEYRQERAYEKNDPTLLSGVTEFLAADSAGGFNVYEGYIEANVPIVKNGGLLLNELSFDGAYRAAQYSTAGRVSAYKGSAVYGPVSWMKLRGTYSRAVRAPNITEAFSPVTPTFFDITDPCDAALINTNVNYPKNCSAAGIPAGFTASTNASITGTIGGNKNLDPEKSRSWTAGFVLQPPMVRGLSLTVDYYSIRIRDAITSLEAQDIIDNCYKASSGIGNSFCGLLTRGADQNINFVSSTYVNAAKLKTDGLEIAVNYARQLGDGSRLTLGLQANYLFHLRSFPFQTDPTQVQIQEAAITTAGDNPHLRALFNLDYRRKAIDLNWSVRYVGEAARTSRDPTTVDHSEARDPAYAEATFYHDLVVRYDLSSRFRGGEVFAGVNNVFDEEPPLGLINGMGAEAGYDLGRYLFAGVRVRR